MNVPETPAEDDKKERAKVNKESVKDDKKEVFDVDKSVDGKDEDAVKIAMKSADLEHNDSNAKNETKNSQSHYQTPPVVLPEGWTYQSTSTGSRGYYTYRSEPTPADLTLVNPDHTIAVGVPQGSPGSGYSVNLGGPGNIIYATGENMPFSIGAPTMHTGGGPVVKSPVKQRSTQENYPVTPSKVKQMPEKLKPMVERHYLLLKSPSFTRQKLELVKIICGFDDTKDKIGIPKDEKRIVVQKYYSDSAKANAAFEAFSCKHQWGGFTTYAELAAEPMIGDLTMPGASDGMDQKPKRKYVRRK